MKNLHRCREPADLDRARVTADVDLVVAVGADDIHAISPTVAGDAAESGCKVDVHRANCGRREVIYGHGVRAAESVEVDALDACGVHQDVAGVPAEPKPRP